MHCVMYQELPSPSFILDLMTGEIRKWHGQGTTDSGMSS